MRMQVEQLEKEKKELNERMRVIAKRLDHVERAYRKDERPLLALDYEIQQANDKEVFEATQKARLEDQRAAHQQALETKKRLARMMDEYNVRKDSILSKRGEEYAAKQAAAQKKIEEEKAKRRAAVLKAREEERLREEEEERNRREKEEEEARLEAGMSIPCSNPSCPHVPFTERIAEEERLAAEEADARAAEEAKKKEEEEKAAEIRRKREEERAAAIEEARMRMQREEEAAERARERKAQAAAAERAPAPDAWRRSNAGAPARPAVTTPLRSESPAPTMPTSKYRPGVLAKEGGWRSRVAEKDADGAASPVRPASPAARPPLAKETLSAKDDDGFQKVEKKEVWRPSRGRGRGRGL